MKKFTKFLVPLLMGGFILASCAWYLFVYDRDFTRDTLLSQARYQDIYGNSRLSAWFYDAAYTFSGHDQNVAIELANQYKQADNYTKAELTLTTAIHNAPTAELYTALCKAYVEQDKLLDAVALLANVSNPEIKAQLDAIRPLTPKADKEPGFYSQYIDLNLFSNGKYLFYSADGTYPSIAGSYVNGTIPLSAGETKLLAISVGDNGLVSEVADLTYTIAGVIEEVVFTDPVMEKAIRDAIQVSETRTVYTNDLWGITEFTAPEGVATFADLSLLPNLTSLTLQNQKIDTLAHLVPLSKLVMLDLTGSRFPTDELELLCSLPSLTGLTLAECSLSTIVGLTNATSLTYLDLSSNAIRNLQPLSGLADLSELHLQHNAVTTLSSLSDLQNLTRLNVSYNELLTLAPLASCSRLRHLEADHNHLASLSGVDAMPQLRHLSVDYNDLTDISILAKNAELENLSIASNAITDIAPLKTLTKLEVFDFSGNLEIAALPAWPEGCALTTIDGSYNALTSLDVLKTMDSLTHVYMDYNQLTNIDALAECFCLVQVNVYGNAIPDVEALREHDIIVNYDPTVK